MVALPAVASLFAVLAPETASSQVADRLIMLADLPQGWVPGGTSDDSSSSENDVFCGISASTPLPDPLGQAEALFQVANPALGPLVVSHDVGTFTMAEADGVMALYAGAFATCSGASFDLNGTPLVLTAEPLTIQIPGTVTVSLRLMSTVQGVSVAVDLVWSQVGDRLSGVVLVYFGEGDTAFTTALATPAAARLQ